MKESTGQRPLDSTLQTPLSAGSNAEEEIEFADLWRILVMHRFLILATTGFSVMLAVVYVLIAKPVYKAEALVTPPEQNSVGLLNTSDITHVSKDEIFSQYVANLYSLSMRKEFIDKNPQLASVTQQFVEEDIMYWRENVPKIGKGKKGDDSLIYVTLQSQEPKLGADWINEFLIVVDKKTIDDYCNTAEMIIAGRRKSLKDKLQKGVEFAVLRRQDKIDLLNEQIAIARSLKMFDRQTPGYVTKSTQGFGVVLNTEQEPLYMRGVKELTEEKALLETRKNDEPFIDNFRAQQESLALLDTHLVEVQMAREFAHAAKIDQPAIRNDTPVKPKKLLVVALSVAFGGVVGVCLAFLIGIIRPQVAQES